MQAEKEGNTGRHLGHFLMQLTGAFGACLGLIRYIQLPLGDGVAAVHSQLYGTVSQMTPSPRTVQVAR